jgi:siroheme synthase
MDKSHFNNRKLSRIFLCAGVHSHSFSLEVVVVLGAHVTFNTVRQFNLTLSSIDERFLHFVGRPDVVYNQEVASLQHDLAVFYTENQASRYVSVLIRNTMSHTGDTEKGKNVGQESWLKKLGPGLITGPPMMIPVASRPIRRPVHSLASACCGPCC